MTIIEDKKPKAISTDDPQQLLQLELDAVNRSIRETILMLDQSKVEVGKLTQRNTAVSGHLQQIQSQAIRSDLGERVGCGPIRLGLPDGSHLDREIVHLRADGVVGISLELGHDFFEGHWIHLLALPQVYGTPRSADTARRPHGDAEWPECTLGPGQGRSEESCLTRPSATSS